MTQFAKLIAACITILAFTLIPLVTPAMADSQATPIGPIAAPFNLANTGTYSVQAELPDPLFHAVESKSYPGPSGGLLSNSTTWTGFLRQSGRTIVVDLGRTETLTGISMDFLENTQMGILYPNHIQFAVSMGGNSWKNAGLINNNQLPQDTGPTDQVFSIPVHRITARYVRISFPVDVWVMARNLKIYGSPFVPSSQVQLPNYNTSKEVLGFLGTGTPQAAGIQNMLLVYSGSNGTQGTWTENQFLPNVAYVTPSGQVQGKMFDSFLFLPYGSSLTTAQGWQNYLQNLFAPGQQLAALNQTVANLQPQFTSLGISENTVNVVLAIPYPNSSITNFGSIPGYPSLSFNSKSAGTATAYANRQQAISWYVHQLLQTYASAHFTHLNLVGLYWDSENVNYAVPNEANLVRSTATLVHSQHLKFYWIPSFAASGLVSWKNFGFDAAIEQPNYIENPKLSIARVDEATKQAQEFGLGLEIEIDHNVFTSQIVQKRYYNQLVSAYINGAEAGVVHAFYAGSQVITNLAYSTNSNLRQLYVDTYDFLIGMFTYQKTI